MRMLKITTDMNVEVVEVRGEPKWRAMAEAIGAEYIDIPHVEYLEDKFCMVVDDEGLLKERPTVNMIASILYGIAKHGQPIVGDVLIGKNEETEDGIETAGLDEEDAVAMVAFFRSLAETLR